MLRPIGYCYVCGCNVYENVTLCSKECIKEYNSQSYPFITEEELDKFSQQQQEDWFIIFNS